MATGKARKVAGGFIEKDCTVKVPLNLDWIIRFDEMKIRPKWP